MFQLTNICFISLHVPHIHLFLNTYTNSANYREEDGSDDNRSSSLGRSVQSDDASLASDNQDDGAPECELNIIVLILVSCACVHVWELVFMHLRSAETWSLNGLHKIS